MPVADPYAVLGISPGADEETIKKAYRQKCKHYHPDLHPNDPAGAGRSYADTSPELQAAGNYIRSGYYREALNVLDGMAQTARTARWHYYAAVACHGLGNNIRAVDEARAAAEMEPGNYQYQNLLDQLQNPGRVYNSYRQARPQPGAPGGSCLSVWMYMLLCNVLSMCCCRTRIFWC